MKLSVLICTIPSRMDWIKKIINELSSQATDQVQFLWLGDNKSMSIGAKRNKLVSIADGDYVIFADDDDRISSDYIKCILAGIESGADVVVFKEYITFNGKNGKEVLFDVRNKNRTHATHYERQPNHRMCIKRDIALKVPYKDISFGEDTDFAMRVNKYLKTQAKIDKILYYYEYDERTSEAKA